MTIGEIILVIVAGAFTAYGCASLLSQLLSWISSTQSPPIWAVVPLSGHLETPELLLRQISSAVLEQGAYSQIALVDVGLDEDSCARCRQLAQCNRFPAILTPTDFCEQLHFLSK